MKLIKQLIPLKLKILILNKYENYKLNKKYKKLSNEKKFFIIGTPHHGNLGDQAIISAEVEFLKENFSEYKIEEINILEYNKKICFFKKHMKDSDVILIHGGGNFGNQYLHDENIRRDVITNFPNNKILLFPQTMYFTNNEDGKKELEISEKIYNNHSNLILVARENVSYELMKKSFKSNKIIMTPDIVLYTKKINNNINKRIGSLFCMRSDVESKFSEKQKFDILKLLEDNYNNVKVTDTVIEKNINMQDRERILEEKFEEFRNAELVITDRIHGMIFAAITGTPCIALSNYNQKVKGTYEWIKGFNYIKFVDKVEDIQQCINELKNVDEINYDNSFLVESYKEIIDEIK